MTTQLSLLDSYLAAQDAPGSTQRARARVSDPETSHEAAQSISGGRMTELQAWILAELKRHPSIDEELENRVDSPASIRSRRAELVMMGKVKWTGGYRETKRGRKARIWRAA